MEKKNGWPELNVKNVFAFNNFRRHVKTLKIHENLISNMRKLVVKTYVTLMEL